MPNYVTHVLVCTHGGEAEDKRHCGDKSGLKIRQKFNEVLARHKLLDTVTVSTVGCTSQHKLCDVSQGTVIVYGPEQSLGGTWYVASPDDVEDIVTEHVVNGRVLEHILNKERTVKPTQA